MKKPTNAGRDVREAALVARAQRGDSDAVAELYRIAEPVILMAVRKHLNGCQNYDAEREAEAACKEAFIRSIEHYDPKRGTSIRTLWFIDFRRAVVGYVRSTARHTKVLVPLEDEPKHCPGIDSPVRPDEAAAAADRFAAIPTMMAIVDQALGALPARDADMWRAWHVCANYTSVGRAFGVPPKHVAAAVQRVRGELQARLRKAGYESA